jgi:ATP-dependent helicase/nuclease subunit B
LDCVMKLNIAPEPEKIMEITKLDLGRLYHRILERFVNWMIEESKLPMTEEEMELYHRRMQEIATAHFAEYQKLGLCGYPLVWELETEFIRQDLSWFVDQEAGQEREVGYVPQRVELSFGYGKAAGEQVALDIGNGRVIFLKGRIDRLDLKAGDRHDFRITDYKSGKDGKITASKLFNGGRQLQLPLYMLAAESLLKTGGERRGMGRFLYVARHCAIKNIEELLEGERLAENEEVLREIIGKIVNGMESGLFFAYPAEKSYDYCDYCDYSAICTSAYRTLAMSKREDKRMEFFRSMREVS